MNPDTDFPNLKATLAGNGSHVEWPAMREEVRRVFALIPTGTKPEWCGRSWDECCDPNCSMHRERDERPEIDTSSRKRLAKLAERCRTSDVRPAEVAMILESVLSAPQRGDKSELAHALRVLHGSKKRLLVPGACGQQMGQESYYIAGSGDQLEILMSAADALCAHRT
jgi:hypothetical protein